MKRRTIHVVALLATGFGFCQNAWADNTYTIKFTSATAYTTSGKLCQFGTIVVENNHTAAITVTVYEGDGTTVILSGTIAAGGSKSGKVNKKGKPKICQPVPLFREETCTDLDEVTDVCPGIPTLSEWSVVAMVLLLLAAGTIVFGRLQRPATASP